MATATARRRSLLIMSGLPYDESHAFDRTPAATARRLKNLQNQAQTLPRKLVPL